MKSVMSAHEMPALLAVSASLQFQQGLVALIPQLRTYSRVLCGRRAIAEDMAQEALAKAWRGRDRFEPGTNLRAWLFTILRNEYCSHGRRAWRETHWDEVLAERVAVPPIEQEWALELSDIARALGGLNKEQREALILVSAGGFSHRDAARLCETSKGTIKSRIARARAALISTLDGDKPIPPRSGARAEDAANQILGQLTALASRGAAGATLALSS